MNAAILVLILACVLHRSYGTHVEEETRNQCRCSPDAPTTRPPPVKNNCCIQNPVYKVQPETCVKTYYVQTYFKANWFVANEYCHAQGMKLASIASKEENDKLAKLITESGYKGEYFWTSGSDKGHEGSFVWMGTGRPVSYSNWLPGEPNNLRAPSGETNDCLLVILSEGKLVWDDGQCTNPMYFVCENMIDTQLPN